VPSPAAVVAAPAVVALWANLSPTFPLALLLVGALALGRFVQLAWARRDLRSAARDPAVVRLALMLALSAGAVWALNPYGAAIFKESLRDPIPPLGVRLWPAQVPVYSWESRALIGSVLVVLAALRLSPRRFTLAEAVLTGGFAVWAWYDKRLAVWWLMLAPWLLAPHLYAMWAAVARRADKEQRPLSFFTRLLLSLSPYVLVGAAAVLVLLSAPARWAMGRPLPAAERVGPMAPYHLAGGLPDHAGAPRRVLNLPYWWGDYLLWRLPRGDEVFWYSRPEAALLLMPERDRARRIVPRLEGADLSAAEWQALLERYRFDTVVMQPESAPALADYLRAHRDGWEVIADNTAADAPGGGPASRGLVAVRRTDPFVLSMTGADAARACVGGLGLSPGVGPWSGLTHLPWAWPPRGQGAGTRKPAGP
jgi:hypothetical protein